ncbi:calcium-binding protein [Thalassococcus lentus]|uniref:Calcium-binding protein n=1 Tax=Thalassococcus lentus TaxID=1210524 RepID=A0ABT4XS07_9RHOB|nr:calcium-binding protein [Thalassococcus lentus]MDA7424743.1 calcium-binding protein [Thalassococcus lentus]
MPSFLIDNSVTATQTLNNNEGGSIGQNGSVLTLGNGIVMSGNSDLIVNGSIQAFATAIEASGTTQFELVVGASGSILSAGNGITADVTTESLVLNSGTISAVGTALSLTADAAAVIPVNHDVVNTGTITSTSTAVVLEIANSGFTEFQNHGVISGTNEGIDNSASADGITFVTNTGTITGGQPFNPSDFAYLGGSGADNLINSGVINGNISLGGGSDFFDGRGGILNGTLRGDDGNDVFRIDDPTVEIVEVAGEGNADRVESWVDYALPDFVERLTLMGASDLNGVGNAQRNVLTGNAGNNYLDGARGNDIIRGGLGNDYMTGGVGNDDISGEDGNDTLLGATGDDTLDGGDGDDVLSGHNGRDSIDGGEGDDVAHGGALNDTLLGREGDDTLSGGSGNDRLLGGPDADLLRGGFGDDDLIGQNGEDTLVGGGGADTLAGGGGADHFVFTLDQQPSLAVIDVVTDFTVGEDYLDLRPLFDGVFEVNILGGFSLGGTPSVRTVEVGGDTRVFVDLDGIGGAEIRIDLIGTVGVTSDDILG